MDYPVKVSHLEDEVPDDIDTQTNEIEDLRRKLRWNRSRVTKLEQENKDLFARLEWNRKLVKHLQSQIGGRGIKRVVTGLKSAFRPRARLPPHDHETD